MARELLRIVQLSDVHLDPSNAEQMPRWHKARDAITKLDPDLVVVSGDLSDDGFASETMFEQLAALMRELPCPALAVPGNHDVGNRSGLNDAVQQGYLDKWNDAFGADYFAYDLGSWRVIGLNSQIMGSRLPCEQEQSLWLEDQLETDRLVAVFLHMPLFLTSPDERVEDRSAYWIPLAEDRDRLMLKLTRSPVRLVGSGHVHWHAVHLEQGILWTWCPPLSGLIVEDTNFPTGGDGAVGFLLHELTSTGLTTEVVALDLPRERVAFSGSDG